MTSLPAFGIFSCWPGGMPAHWDAGAPERMKSCMEQEVPERRRRLFSIYNYFLEKERGTNMLHPSYHDLMSRVNSEVETGEAPIVNSRYSIVLATAKRARQLIEGVDALTEPECPKPLSVAIDELALGEIHILSEEEALAAERSQAFGEEESETELDELAVSTEDEFSGEEGTVSEESSEIE